MRVPAAAGVTAGGCGSRGHADCVQSTGHTLIEASGVQSAEPLTSDACDGKLQLELHVQCPVSSVGS